MVTIERDGTSTFRLYLPHAECVEVAGDFTNWKDGAIRMVRDHAQGPGWWMARLRLCAGDHPFSYVVDDRYWMPDYAASGVHRDNAGHWIGTVCVPTRPRMRRPDREERHTFLTDWEMPDRAASPEAAPAGAPHRAWLNTAARSALFRSSPDASVPRGT